MVYSYSPRLGRAIGGGDGLDHLRSPFLFGSVVLQVSFLDDVV